MEEFFKNNAGSFISAFIAVIGFVVTYLLTNKNLKNGIKQIKQNKSIDLIQNMPYEILSLFDLVNSMKINNLLPKLNNIYYTIYAYGSKEAIKILVVLQRNIYNTNKSTNKQNNNILFLLSLLVSQIKYDIIGEIINPLDFLKIKITDYEEKLAPIAKQELESIINENNLNKIFIIK